ncbi:platelet glycoprotein Ib beta chain isoform X2 [Narcine bancroftii]
MDGQNCQLIYDAAFIVRTVTSSNVEKLLRTKGQDYAPSTLLFLLQARYVIGSFNRKTDLRQRKVITMARRQGLFLVLLSMLPAAVFQCPERCRCSGTMVDCSGQELTASTIPRRFPPATRQIQLSHNKLSTIPNGLFDSLRDLESVTLDNNPWACDCNIQYLRSWLLKQDDKSQYKHLNCSSPAALQDRRILYLTEDEVISTCDG